MTCRKWNFASLLWLVVVSTCSTRDTQSLEGVLLELENGLHIEQRRLTAQQAFDDQNADEMPEFTDEVAAQINGDLDTVREIAHATGFELISPVNGFDDVYRLRRANKMDKRGLAGNGELDEDERVLWSEPQRVKRRVKRDGSHVPSHSSLHFNDLLWEKQWYLHDTRALPNLPKLDLHAMGAWEMGFSGKGVVVTILDDGIQHDHPDLAQNYDPKASYDLNDDDPDPMPTFNEYNKHGTRCAGEVAMVANNHLCGVGVAFNAKIGGIRMLDGKITDRLEAEALHFAIDHVDIFSASWGPNDDGKTVEGPGRLAGMALLNGIVKGRQGKGTIYVWASGNGGSYEDDCDCDGYTDSIYTLSVSSASESGRFPWYGEKCSSTLATTYSSGAYTDQKIATTDLGSKCTTEHTGTSASAPLAAGIVALGLEANKNLTWREVQHITVWSSEPAPLMQNPGWHKNGIGLHVNTRFGFGLMNAQKFVSLARNWTTIPPQKTCTTTFPKFKNKSFGSEQAGIVKFSTDACEGQKNEINFLEHVQLVTDIEYTRRGNLAIYLVSPKKTRTKLLSPRRRDNSKAGFRRWPFMSVHTWGENPKGWWQLEVHDEKNLSGSGSDFGSVTNLTLIMYGTTESPAHYKQGRHYDMNYNDVHDRGLGKQKMKELAAEAGKQVLTRSREAATPEDAERHLADIGDALDLINRSLNEERERRAAVDADRYGNTWSK